MTDDDPSEHETIETDIARRATVHDIAPVQSIEMLEGDGTIPSGFEASSHLSKIIAKGKYKHLTQLGSGGMGLIVQVFDETLGRDVAMKVMRGSSTRQNIRFVSEAQITGQLEHPNIVPVHELGVDKAGRSYFTMKLVRGRSLAEVLNDKPEQKPGQWFLINMFINICNGIDYAHAKRVIHRDLKPDNIMVGEYGEVMVMDWGLAKNLSDQHSDNADERSASSVDEIFSDTAGDASSHNTLDGSIIGTPAYMSPEQAQGKIKSVDGRSDIYALGGILYEILTGHPPVNCKTLDETIHAAAHGHIPPPESHQNDLPPELAAICMKALRYNPDNRYQTVADLREDVLGYLDGRSISAKIDSLPEQIAKFYRRHRAICSISILAATLVIAAFIFSAIITSSIKKEQELVQLENKELVAAKETLETELYENTKPIWREVWSTHFDKTKLQPYDKDWNCHTGWDSHLHITSKYLRHLPKNIISLEQDGLKIMPERVAPLHLIRNAAYHGDMRIIYRVTWHEGTDGGFNAILRGSHYSHGYIFNIGGWGNTSTRILRADGNESRPLAESTWIPSSGTTYLVVAQISGNTLSLTINDQELLSVTDENGILGGDEFNKCGLYFNNTSCTLHDVTIEERAPSQLTDILDIADHFLSLREYRTAIMLYRDILLTANLSKDRKRRANEGLENATINNKIRAGLKTWRDQLINHGWKKEHFQLYHNADGLSLRLLAPISSNLTPLIKPKIIPLNRLIAGPSLTNSSIKTLAELPLHHLTISDNKHITTLEPLSNAKLKTINITNCSKLKDLGPLRLSKLIHADLSYTQISSLDNLSKMPLQSLMLDNTLVTDLSPLAATPQSTLTTLSLAYTGITSLAGIENCKLEQLFINGTSLSSLSTFTSESLRELNINSCSNITSLDFVQNLPALSKLFCTNCSISSLLPLENIHLQSLMCDENPIASIEPLLYNPPTIFSFSNMKLNEDDLFEALDVWEDSHPDLAEQVQDMLGMK